MMLRRFLGDVSATEVLGDELARTMPDTAVVFLRGDLGAGKSSLARSLLRSLGVTGAIKSPTYTLVERYPLPAGEAAHLDLYRIAEAAELEFLGLADLRAEARVWLVEWPERGEASLPPPDLQILLEVLGEGRAAELRGATPAGENWLAALSKMAALSTSS